MKKLWHLLNTPLLAIFFALTTWTALGELTGLKTIEIRNTISKNDSFDQKSKAIQAKIQLLQKIYVKNIKSVNSNWKEREKIIGEIVNGTDKTINSILITFSFYNNNGELIDVNTRRFSNLIVLPKDKYSFDILRDLGKRNDTDAILNERRSQRIEVKVVDFEFLK